MHWKNNNYLLIRWRAKKQDIGVELLNKSEEYITANGYDKIVIGTRKDYITPGIPMNNGAHTFKKTTTFIHEVIVVVLIWA